MWLWQRDKAKLSLVVHMVSIVLAAHAGVMGLLFLVYGRSSVHAFTVNTQTVLPGQRVVVLPFYKKVVGRNGKTATIHKPKKSIAKKVQTVPIKKAAKKRVAQNVPKRTKSTPAQNRPSIVKKPEKEIKKQQPAVPAPLEKLDEKPVQPQEQVADEPVTVTPEQTTELVGDANVVYMNQEEHDMFVMHEQIQHEVARCWRPPLGVTPGTRCVVTFYVSWQGQLESCTVQEPSGILMFDMSVRASLKDMVFPRSFYGKKCTLTFMQEK